MDTQNGIPVSKLPQSCGINKKRARVEEEYPVLPLCLPNHPANMIKRRKLSSEQAKLISETENINGVGRKRRRRRGKGRKKQRSVSRNRRGKKSADDGLQRSMAYYLDIKPKAKKIVIPSESPDRICQSGKHAPGFKDIYSQEDVPDGHYKLILVDPPWTYQHNSFHPSMRGFCVRQYNVMSDDELCKIPVARISAEKSYLFLWTTAYKLQSSFKLIEAWGFKYITVFLNWHKTNKKEPGVLNGSGLGFYNRVAAEYLLIAENSGDEPISATYVPAHVIIDDEGTAIADDVEMLLIGSKGAKTYSELCDRSGDRKGVCNVIHEDAELPWQDAILCKLKTSVLKHSVGNHSEKPHIVYNMIERMFHKATPRIELFARNTRRGWDCYGNEV